LSSRANTHVQTLVQIDEGSRAVPLAHERGHGRDDGNEKGGKVYSN